MVGYGQVVMEFFIFIFLRLWCSNAVVVVAAAAGDLWVVVGRWGCGVVIFFIILLMIVK